MGYILCLKVQKKMGFFLGVFLSFLLGCVVIYLPNIFLPLSNSLWYNEFVDKYPEKKWVPYIYPIFLIIGMFGFFAFGGEINPYLNYRSLFSSSFYAFSCATVGVGISVGVFEALTGISPIPIGAKRIKDSIFYFKAPWINQYRYNPYMSLQTRFVGIIRALFGIAIIALFIIVGRFFVI
jgi:hypothetical protein